MSVVAAPAPAPRSEAKYRRGCASSRFVSAAQGAEARCSQAEGRHERQRIADWDSRGRRWRRCVVRLSRAVGGFPGREVADRGDQCRRGACSTSAPKTSPRSPTSCPATETHHRNGNHHPGPRVAPTNRRERPAVAQWLPIGEPAPRPAESAPARRAHPVRDPPMIISSILDRLRFDALGNGPQPLC